VDAAGRTRNFSYTDLGQVLWATDLGGTNFGGMWTNVYASDGALLGVVSPTGETNSFIYDELDNLRTNKFSDGYQLVNFYDAANRLASNNLPSGAVVQYRHDDAGRLTNRFSSLGETAEFHYNGNDAITNMVDNTGSTTNLFDDAGQLSGIDYPTGASVRYYRDLLGRITNVTTKASGGGSSYTTKYWHDAVGNLTNVVDPLSGTTRFEYDRVNRRTKRVLPNGVTTTYEYNWRDQVTNIVHKTSGGTLLASAFYERTGNNSLGEPTKIVREGGTNYVVLKYDSALRLTNEVHYINGSSGSGGTVAENIGYGYDKAGTRIHLSNNSGTFTNAVNAGYRVTQVKNGAAVTETYGFDNGGRVTNIVRGTVTLKLGYNTADQLTAVTNGANWTNYIFDATGRRVKATDQSGAQRRFLVAPAPGSDLESPHLVADSGNSLQVGYVHIGGEPLLRFNASGNPVYYLEDAMGSVIGLVSNGTSVATFNYDGFGKLRSASGSSTNAPNGTGGDFRFHGQWLEAASGMYHMRARDYDPLTGRFLSRDPAQGDTRVPETLHPYAFANNNALVFSDPSGEFSVTEINISGAIQSGLQGARTAAINEGKKFVRQKIGEFVADQFFNVLKGFLPINLNVLGELAKGANHKYAGFRFSKFAEEFLCDELDLPDSIWFEPQVRRNGRVVSNGLSCSDRGSQRTPLGPCPLVPRPDFIIGREPPVNETTGIHSRAYVIGELKLSGMGLYRSYVKPKKQEGQLLAVLNY